MPDDSDLPRTGGVPDQPPFFRDSTTRRVFLTRVASTGTVVALGPSLLCGAKAQTAGSAPDGGGAEAVEVKLVINERAARLRIDPRVTLLDALREHLHLTGSK